MEIYIRMYKKAIFLYNSCVHYNTQHCNSNTFFKKSDASHVLRASLHIPVERWTK